MSNHLIFNNTDHALRTLSLLTGANIRIAKDSLFERAKNWLKEKFTGFKKFDLDKESSAISYVRYNKKKKVLEVKFKERGVYQYLGVPEKDFLTMMDSSSKGKFLNKKIKNRYKFKKIASKKNRRVRIAKKLSRSVFIGRLLVKQAHQLPK